MLRILSERTDGIYLAITGVTTAIASHYLASSVAIENRWGVLDKTGQKLFSITAPLCLYSESELINLLTETGWDISWSRISDFGNIKVVANIK